MTRSWCGDGWTGRPIALLLMAGLLAGCSGIRAYESPLPPNLTAKARLTSGGLLSTTAPVLSNFHVDMDVVYVDQRCQRSYRGTVKLGGKPVSIGLPTNQPTFLVFDFIGRSFLHRGLAASASYSTLITPRSGYLYDVDISYADEMYNITVLERHPRSGHRTEVERRPFSDCQVRQ